MLQLLRRIFGRRNREPRRPLELTVADQWTLKYLFLTGDSFVAEDRVVDAVLAERPTLLPYEVTASLHKLHLVGALEHGEAGGYKVTAGARKLKSILPEQPSVNIDYYG